MTIEEQAAEYMKEGQRTLGLALLVVMKETGSKNCMYETEIVGKDGKKYLIITSIEQI